MLPAKNAHILQLVSNIARFSLLGIVYRCFILSTAYAKLVFFFSFARSWIKRESLEPDCFIHQWSFRYEFDHLFFDLPVVLDFCG